MVVDDVHGGPREYVGGSDQAGEPHRVAEGLGRLEAGQLFPPRLSDLNVVQHPGELETVLSHVNALQLGQV